MIVNILIFSICKTRSFSYSMTKHAALNLLQREQRYEHDDASQADAELSEDSPLISLEQEELFALYQNILDSLPERCREIFLLVKEEGHTYAEVADLLHISTKTVDAQLQKALKTLRSALDEYQPKTPSGHPHRFISIFL